MDTISDSDSDSVVDPHFTGQAEEGELSDLDQDVSVTDTDQATSDEQNYFWHGIRSFMGWTHIPDIDSATSSAEDNLFAAPKQQQVGQPPLRRLVVPQNGQFEPHLGAWIPVQKFGNRRSAKGSVCEAG